jgi:hypothetical protein
VVEFLQLRDLAYETSTNGMYTWESSICTRESSECNKCSVITSFVTNEHAYSTHTCTCIK